MNPPKDSTPKKRATEFVKLNIAVPPPMMLQEASEGRGEKKVSRGVSKEKTKKKKKSMSVNESVEGITKQDKVVLIKAWKESKVVSKRNEVQKDGTDVEMTEWSQNMVSEVVENVNAISAVPSQQDNFSQEVGDGEEGLGGGGACPPDTGGVSQSQSLLK